RITSSTQFRPRRHGRNGIMQTARSTAAGSRSRRRLPSSLSTECSFRRSCGANDSQVSSICCAMPSIRSDSSTRSKGHKAKDGARVPYGSRVHLNLHVRATSARAIAEAPVQGLPSRQEETLIEVHTLTDGGQTSLDVAHRIASFLAPARETLELALYVVRVDDDSEKIVEDALVAAHNRGVHVRLLYNLDE